MTATLPPVTTAPASGRRPSWLPGPRLLPTLATFVLFVALFAAGSLRYEGFFAGQVLLNLFENARLAKATAVSATVCDDRLEDGAPAVRLAVSDDGTGIAEEVLPRIFEPHFSTRTSGSGLGLAITRRLVESWGGTVTIESKLGEGTRVTVRLKAVA